MRKLHNVALIGLFFLSLAASGCAFDGSTLDERACDEDQPCQPGFECVGGYCHLSDNDVLDLDMGDGQDEEIDVVISCDPGTCDGECCDDEDNSTICVDTSSDRDNCGGCGLFCPPGETCEDGLCSGGCPPLKGDCDGNAQNGCETDLLADDENCGACDKMCDAPLTCGGGVCACNGDQCNESESCCDDGSGTLRCLNITGDTTNCGGCGVTCGDSEMCVDGSCTCGQISIDGGPACSNGLVCCGDVCADLQTHSDHCGTCGNACAAGQSCNAGSCECDDPMLTTCDDDCTDLQSEPHCGGCGITCGPLEICCGGGCQQIGSTDACPATDCPSLRSMGFLQSGVYWVTLGEPTPRQVYCEFGTSGGGWTLAMRSVWSWADTSALQTDFATWAGTTIGTPGSGAYRIEGNLLPTLQNSGEHLVKITLRRPDGTNCMPLSYTAEGDWVVNMADASINSLVQPTAQIFLSPFLSTTDVGPRSQSCVVSGNAIPWPYGACCRFCPAFETGLWSDEPHPSLAATSSLVPDLNNRTVSDVCGMSGAFSDLTPNYVGANIFEYYVR